MVLHQLDWLNHQIGAQQLSKGQSECQELLNRGTENSQHNYTVARTPAPTPWILCAVFILASENDLEKSNNDIQDTEQLL